MRPYTFTKANAYGYHCLSHQSGGICYVRRTPEGWVTGTPTGLCSPPVWSTEPKPTRYDAVSHHFRTEVSPQ